MNAPAAKDIEVTYEGGRTLRNDLGDGFYAVVTTPYDTDMGPPWKEYDGYGPVSEWTSRDKRPGEWVLSRERFGSKRYYDFAEAVGIARRDGWGLCPEHLAELTAKLGRPPTKGQIAVASVEKGFEFLQDWCENRWHWIGVCVDIFNADDEEVYSDSIWGVEDSTDYWQSLAVEFIEAGIRKIETETAEATYWACRDVVTV
jgi:hypothetical protein